MPEQKNMDKQLVILKLVAAAIVSGVLVFWIVVVALMSAKPPEPKLVLPFTLILLVLVAPAVAVPAIVRGLFVKETRRSLAASSVGADLAQIVAARLLLYTIVSMAGAELLGFVAAAGYMLNEAPGHDGGRRLRRHSATAAIPDTGTIPEIPGRGSLTERGVTTEPHRRSQRTGRGISVTARSSKSG